MIMYVLPVHIYLTSLSLLVRLMQYVTALKEVVISYDFVCFISESYEKHVSSYYGV